MFCWCWILDYCLWRMYWWYPDMVVIVLQLFCNWGMWQILWCHLHIRLSVCLNYLKLGSMKDIGWIVLVILCLLGQRLFWMYEFWSYYCCMWCIPVCHLCSFLSSFFRVFGMVVLWISLFIWLKMLTVSNACEKSTEVWLNIFIIGLSMEWSAVVVESFGLNPCWYWSCGRWGLSML